MINPSGMFWRPRGSRRRLQSIYTVAKLINFFPIRQVVQVGLAWALLLGSLGSVFHRKKNVL